jgi:hypothetical protein
MVKNGFICQPLTKSIDFFFLMSLNFIAYNTLVISFVFEGIGLWCLRPLSTIFHLYRGWFFEEKKLIVRYT